MHRVITEEWLDALPAEDARAQHSRRDLYRLNRWMGHPRFLARCIGSLPRKNSALRLVDLGGGDGRLLLAVAQRLGPRFGAVNLRIVDRAAPVSESLRRQFQPLGWELELDGRDVSDWASQASGTPCDLVISNLFLHHFDAQAAQQWLRAVAERTRRFVALEPRRGAVSLGFSHLVALIGCNAVTRHDAVVSVRAGFRHREVSALWPETTSWQVEERRYGLFSHLFDARRTREDAE
jgi:hypothetical protein